MNRVLNVVRVSRAKIDASKLFVPCLAKEPFRAMGLEGWSMGRGGGGGEARLRDSIVAGLQIEG